MKMCQSSNEIVPVLPRSGDEGRPVRPPAVGSGFAWSIGPLRQCLRRHGLFYASTALAQSRHHSGYHGRRDRCGRCRGCNVFSHVKKVYPYNTLKHLPCQPDSEKKSEALYIMGLDNETRFRYIFAYAKHTSS